MRIQQAACLAGLTPDTIRFYERMGILPAPPRQRNGYRHYTEEHVATLRLAKGLRQLGIPLGEIAIILTLAHDGACSENREVVVSVSSKVLTDLDRKLDELTNARNHLAEILVGLRRMRPRQGSVPGVRPCACVRMVTAT